MQAANSLEMMLLDHDKGDSHNEGSEAESN